MDSVRLPGKRGRPRSKPDALAGDNAYSPKRIRHYCHRRNITPVIPENKQQRRNRTKKPGRKPRLNKVLYRQRNIVERLIGWLKENRRLAMRFEKRPENYLAFLHIAIVRRLLRQL